MSETHFLAQAVASTAREISLLEYSTNVAVKGLEGLPPGKLRLGVDANLWMCQLDVVFVFDGPNRPSIKCKKKVVATPPWLTECLMDMAEAFGFEAYTAPGEAEAELAFLNQHKMIDAVITEDSDCLVFGAVKVLRCVNGLDQLNMYLSSEIAASHEVSLSCSGLLLMAVLCGGDYNNGLRGCGWTTALGLARYRLGDNLFDAMHNLEAADLAAFITSWRDRLCQMLARDPAGHLRRCHPALAKIASSGSFPDLDVVRAYTHPVTSGDVHQIIFPRSRQLNVDWLAYMCELRFGWTHKTPASHTELLSTGTLGKFRSRIWEGVCLRALYKLYLTQGTDDFESVCSTDLRPHGFTPLSIERERKAPQPSQALRQHYVKISV
ncbi:PIN domain-like protein [Paxillus ammoniavirescens]|nr:PIN domain-like protein [Paxillus ammoniavirescens]